MLVTIVTLAVVVPNYSDYRINGKAGESTKVSREDTLEIQLLLIAGIEQLQIGRLDLHTKNERARESPGTLFVCFTSLGETVPLYPKGLVFV